ncbi:hypothetical protein ACFDTO_32765 [Microbacteriaceae bacterium 4G12]
MKQLIRTICCHISFIARSHYVFLPFFYIISIVPCFKKTYAEERSFSDYTYKSLKCNKFVLATQKSLEQKTLSFLILSKRQKEDEFEFNKDAGMYVCKAGHMAIRKARQGKKNTGENQRDTRVANNIIHLVSLGYPF